MMRLIVFLLVITAAAYGLAQVADRPGTVTLTWLGYQVEVSVLFAIVALGAVLVAAALAWSLLRYIVTRPAELSRQLRERKEERGMEALSQGLIAVGAGDREQAGKFASLARKRLPNEPLTALLRAQAAQLRGDREEARRIFQSMAEQPRTELLGLRGLFLEARREEETEAARQFAQRAMERNPDLAWSVKRAVRAAVPRRRLGRRAENSRRGAPAKTDRPGHCRPTQGRADHRPGERAGGYRACARARPGAGGQQAGAGPCSRGRDHRAVAGGPGQRLPRRQGTVEGVGAVAPSRPGTGLRIPAYG